MFQHLSEVRWRTLPVDELLTGLSHSHIEQYQPILQRLESKTAEDESNAECSKPAFGKVVSVVLDVRINCYPQNRPELERVSNEYMATSIEQWLVYREFINNNIFELTTKRRASLHCRTYFKPSSPSYCWMTA